MTVKCWKLITAFLLLSGLCIGEVIALNDRDVGTVIHVTKTYTLVINAVSTTKTAMSTRDVDVQLELAECMKRIRAFVREDEKMYGYRPDLFLPNFGCGCITYDVYNKYFRENCERIIGRKLSPHALWHTHTAMLVKSGFSLKTVSRSRSGHANSVVTKSVYMHVIARFEIKTGTSCCRCE